MNYGDYALFYHVDDDRQLVEIIAFRHGRRKSWPEVGPETEPK